MPPRAPSRRSAASVAALSAASQPVRMRSHRMAVSVHPHRCPLVPHGRPSRDHAHDPDTPAPDRQATSGNPATQAQINLTVKQQREQKRQEKLAEYQKQLAKRRRSKLVWWVVGSRRRRRRHRGDRRLDRLRPGAPADATSPGDGDGATIEGVETFENTAKHVEGAVDYAADSAGRRRAQRGLAELRHLRPAGPERERGALDGARRGLGDLRPRGGLGDELATLKSAAALDVRRPLAVRGHGLADRPERTGTPSSRSTPPTTSGSPSSSRSTGAARTSPSRTRSCTGALDAPGKQ